MSFVGQSIRRREDARLLLGKGQYIADLELPGMLHAVFVRSPHAHARLARVDVRAALAAPGVRAVFIAADEASIIALLARVLRRITTAGQKTNNGVACALEALCGLAVWEAAIVCVIILIVALL